MKHWRLRKKTIFRTFLLIVAAIAGIGLAFFIYPDYIYDLIDSYSSINNILHNGILHNSITILFLGFPTFYVLWVFRTGDVQKQIVKTEENTNNSTFFECARMLTEVKSAEGKPTKYDSLSKKIALEQLVYLKIEIGFDKKRIDSLTRGLDLRDKNFNFARFNDLDLSKADLSRAKLNEADLSGAELNEAKLNGAELNGTNLTLAELNGADLSGAKLNIAVSLSGTESNRVTDTRKTKLKGAILNGVNLTKAILIGADLTEAKLNEADLRGAKLNEADLRGAKLNGIKLTGVKLTEADLTEADLNDTDLTGAIYNDETEFNDTNLESQEMRDKAGMEYRENEPV